MRPVATTLATKAEALVRYGQRLGIERARLLSSAGIGPDILERAGERVTLRSVVTLWTDLARSTGDSDIGLRLAESEATSGAFGVVGFLAMTSATVRDGLARFVRFTRLVSDGSNARLLEERETLTFELVLPEDGAALRWMADRAMTSCLLLTRRWTGEGLRPRGVAFRHAKPPDVSGYERFFDCPIAYGQEANAIAFDRSASVLRLRTAQADVAAYLESIAATASADLPQGDAAGAVAEALRLSFSKGDPGLPAIARRLGVSARTLQRRLLGEGLSYHRIADRVRRETAIRLVTSTSLPLTVVRERAGYADDKAFRRAFRRWTGLSPADLRRRSRGESR